MNRVTKRYLITLACSVGGLVAVAVMFFLLFRAFQSDSIVFIYLFSLFAWGILAWLNADEKGRSYWWIAGVFVLPILMIVLLLMPYAAERREALELSA